jgi:4-diphosphocytidyl-2-C-methyl-D-erythritol kinase
MHLLAPAKINLALRVLDRRPDGYHEIDTVMVPLAWGDDVELAPAPSGIRVACDPPVTSRPQDNLAWKAASLVQARAGRTNGVSIRIAKKIPAAAGLGGGSSDAAAVLRGLAALWDLDVAAEGLLEWAAELGSDVPFFLAGGPARCRGRGERVDPIRLPGCRPVVLARPEIPVSTAWAYAALDEATSALTPRQALPNLAPDRGEIEGWTRCGNDFEPVVLRKFPVLEILEERMTEFGASSVSLSGSGPTVFGLCDDPGTASCLAEGLRASFGKHLWMRTTTTTES